MGPTRENLTLVRANNKGEGLYSYPRSLISAFIVRLLESSMSKLASCKISFQLVSVAEQTGLSHTQKPARQVSPEMALMYLTTYLNHRILLSRQVYWM